MYFRKINNKIISKSATEKKHELTYKEKLNQFYY